MAGGEQEKLRSLLRERTARAASAALANGGSVSQEEIDNLRKLADLCSALDSTASKPKASRWFPAVMFVAALVCASFLLFRRVAVTQVEIDVSAASAEFRLAQTRSLTDTAVVTSLRLTGVRKLSANLCDSISGESTPRDFTLRGAIGTNTGTITLQPIEAKKGVSVSISAEDSPSRWVIGFSGAPQTVKATFEGSLRVDGEPCRIEAKFPRTLEAALDEKSSRVVLDFARTPHAFFPPLLPVDRLAFVRTDVLELGGTIERMQSSTLGGGSIFFEELEGKENKLRDGEWLDIGVRQGWLRTPRAAGPSLAWRYRGSVDTLRSGPPNARRDLKPSWLEYARAQHGIGLLWGTALSLFGLGGTLIRWFKA